MKAGVEYDSGLLLFVAGLPSKASPGEVKEFFSCIGNVRLLRLRTNKKGTRLTESNAQNNIRRGFCVLEALDRWTFKTVLHSTGIVYQNRKLAITQLRDRESFATYAEDLSRRKVVVSGVPRFLSPTDLCDQLMFTFGEIRKVTPHKSSQNLVKAAIFNHREFLVEFVYETAAQLALCRDTVQIMCNGGAYTLSVRQYQTCKQKTSEPSSANGSSAHTLKSGTVDPHLMKYAEKFQDINANKITSGEISCLKDGKKLLPWNTHFLKPTSQRYHETRSKVASYHNLNGNGNQYQNSLRFNFLTFRLSS